MKVLLRVPSLQSFILDVLVEKIHDFSVAGEQVDNLPRLLLREIRWLEHVEDTTALTEKLIELLDAAAAPISLRCEVCCEQFAPTVIIRSQCNISIAR
jgi:fanconi anemia group D2 protein